MIPVINILGREIGIYAILALAGALTSGVLVYRQAKRKQLDEIEAIVVMLIASIGIFIGMHLLYGITQIPYIPRFIENPPPLTPFGDAANIFFAVFGGSVFYGGLLGGLAAGFLCMRYRKLDTKSYTDLIVPAIPLFHMFGRIGCFLGGCCYGIECPVGFTYTYAPIPEANGVSRFPVQLLEAFVLFILFVILFALFKKGVWRGKLLYIYLLSYSFFRFFLEFLRGDEYRGIYLGLSTSQLISMILFVFAAGVLLAGRRKSAKIQDK